MNQGQEFITVTQFCPKPDFISGNKFFKLKKLDRSLASSRLNNFDRTEVMDTDEVMAEDHLGIQKQTGELAFLIKIRKINANLADKILTTFNKK